MNINTNRENMTTRKFLFMLTIAFVAMGISFSSLESSELKYKISNDSKLWFDGTSTIHDFTCHAKKMQGEVSIQGDLFAPDKSGKLNMVSLVIPVKHIENDDDDLTENMHEAFKLEDHANITFKLVKADLLDVNKNIVEIKAKGNLKISGISKVVYFNLTIKKKGNALTVKGSTSIKMSHYGIDPPSMFFGAVTTDDEVKISFILILKKS